MDLKQHIIDFIRKAAPIADTEGFFREPLVGFSSAHDPLYDELPRLVGPHHAHPKDELDGVETVVSFFLPLRREVVLGNRGGAVASDAWAKAYIAGNGTINGVCESLAADLTEQGLRTASVRATHTFDPVSLKAGWSHRSAACIAGLGRFGVNRMLITKKGCAGRFGTLFTDAQIEPDPFVEEERCPYLTTGACGVCMKSCPEQALHPDEFDRQRCNAHLLRNAEHFTAYGFCDVCGKCSVGPCAYKE